MRAQVSLRLVQRGTPAGRRQNVSERLLRGRRHARSSCCYKPSSARPRKLREHVSDLLLVPAGSLPFDKHVVATKRVDEPVQDTACEHRAPSSQRAHERTPPATSEDDEVTSGLA